MTSNPASVGPAPDGEGTSSAFYRVGEFIGNRPVLCEHGRIDPNNLCPYCEGELAYPGRAPHPDREAEPTEAAEIVRRWASWIIDESRDMDVDDHDAGKRKVRAERDLILQALSVSPPVVEGSSLRDTPPGAPLTVLVPIEPTPEMLEPFARVLCSALELDPDEPEAPHGHWPTWYGQCAPLAVAYRAMIEATRHQPTTPGGE